MCYWIKKRDDFKKPFIGIASTGYEGNPFCNMHLNDLSLKIKESINSKLAVPLFNTIGISDGISMGTRE